MKAIVTKRLAALTVSDIDQVYKGKQGKCYCGCAGRYAEGDRAKAAALAALLRAPDVKVLPMRLDQPLSDQTILTFPTSRTKECSVYLKSGLLVAAAR